MHETAIDRDCVTGVILAGGEARRMGRRDKGLLLLAERPMIEYVLSVMQPQVGAVLINANRNHSSYGRYGFPVVADEYSGFNGPLAGMASCMRLVKTEYMATAPCDSPFIPADLVIRLARKLERAGAEISVAHNGERMQPVFSLIRTDLLDSLLQFLARGERKIDKWFAGHRTVMADFADEPRTFLNINTPADLQKIEIELESRRHAAG